MFSKLCFDFIEDKVRKKSRMRAEFFLGDCRFKD
jgi:hypothetical protein